MFRSVRKHAAWVAASGLTAAAVAMAPVSAHVTKKVKHSWKHFQPLADARYDLKGTPAQWAQIQGVPAGFADGVDDVSTTATDIVCSGCVGTTDLGFDPATQAELNAHETSGAHDDRYWKLSGDALTGAEFLGSTNSQPLNLRVNNARAFRLEPAIDPGGGGIFAPNVVGGGPTNSVTAGAFGATIAGGGRAFGGVNRVTDSWGTVGGGFDNQVGNASGDVNDGAFATVGGGESNTASGIRATVSGGRGNTANGVNATVGGGNGNIASGGAATVPGGDGNLATADNAFAAGDGATADDQGAFVWADSQAPDVFSPGMDTFTVSAGGGIWLGTGTAPAFMTALRFIDTSTGGYLSDAGAWTDFSSREVKENFARVDPRDILERVARLPITTWNYEAQPRSIRHIGPVAEDFHAAFGIGDDPRHIASLDTGGVALAAIQGLYQEVRDLRGATNESTAPVSGILTALAVVGLALGIALVGRRGLVWGAGISG